MAAYGPNGTLFSLGPDFTVQQYDVEQSRIVANIRHMPSTIPPTPPEENRQLGWTTSESEEDPYSPIAQSRKPPIDRNRMISPQSQMSGTTSIQSRPSRYSSRQRNITSPGQQSEMTGTTFSAGTHSTYMQDYAKSPGSSRNYRKSSKLRQEVLMSPHERPIDDLFPFTRARLNDVPYKAPRPLNDSEMTPDNLRRQMLHTVFGWTEDIHDLVRDEMSRHAPDSQHSIFLSKWLDEDDGYLCEVMGGTSVLSSMDWMLLALGTVDHSATSKRISQVFIEKMLSRGDVHAAATMLLALGDRSDAIEVYVSRNQFLEAIILTCLATPADWQRQSHLVRKWGEHVVGNSQQQFAIRCFSCAGNEPSEPWTSPTVPNMMSQSMNHVANYGPDNSTSDEETKGYPEVYKNALARRRGLDAPTPVAMPAPPTPFRNAASQQSRMTPQTSALKLITSFGVAQDPEYKFPGLKSADYTPTAANSVTPIAESAIDRSALSPGGSGSYRQNNIRSLNAALSARPTMSGHRNRLPSIGETPVDVEGPSFKHSPPPPLPNNQLPTPADSNSDREREMKDTKQSNPTPEHVEEQSKQSTDVSALTLTPARYEPNNTPKEKNTPQTAVRPRPAAEFPQSMPRADSRQSDLEELAAADKPRPRTGSRSRKPDGLSINLAPTVSDYVQTGQHSGTQPRTGQTYSTTQFDTNSEMTSPLRTGDTLNSRGKSPSVSGRSIDHYISSLEQAQYYNQNSRSRETSSSKMTEKRNRALMRRGSDTQEQRTINPAKKSPSSPVSMSPEDLRAYTQSVDSLNSPYASTLSGVDRIGTPASRSRLGRHQAQSHREESRRQRSHSAKAKMTREETSPERRSRSRSRKDRGAPRSPSSPLPMVPSEEDRNQTTDSSLRFVSADRQHRSRDASRHRERSNEPRRRQHRSRSRQAEEPDGHLSRRSSASARAGRRHRKTEASAGPSEHEIATNGFIYDSLTGGSTTTLSLDPEARPPSLPTSEPRSRRRELAKELAAAELEARRLSLARRPSAPNIPFPGQITHGKSASESHAPPLFRAHTDDGSTRPYDEPRVRRPGTPRAMQVDSETVDEAESALQELLPNSTYQTPNLGTNLSPRPATSHSGRGHARNGSNGFEDLRTAEDIEAALTQLPRHPAFNAKVARSRENSRTRAEHSRTRGEHSRTRGLSRDRNHMSPNLEDMGPMIIDTGALSSPPPPVLPELQHLVTPPPPPPPPAPPKDRPQLSVRTAEAAARVPLPGSANPRTDDGIGSGHPNSGHPNSATPGYGHRRGRSGNLGSESQFMGKIKNFAGKMRTPSQNRDNTAKSPPQQWQNGEGFEGASPYETNTGWNQQGGQATQVQ